MEKVRYFIYLFKMCFHQVLKNITLNSCILINITFSSMWWMALYITYFIFNCTFRWRKYSILSKDIHFILIYGRKLPFCSIRVERLFRKYLFFLETTLIGIQKRVNVYVDLDENSTLIRAKICGKVSRSQNDFETNLK